MLACGVTEWPSRLCAVLPLLIERDPRHYEWMNKLDTSRSVGTFTSRTERVRRSARFAGLGSWVFLKSMACRSVTTTLVCIGRHVASRTSLRPIHTSSCYSSTQPNYGFKPGKVAVVTKTTRYEFEQQRYRYAGLSEEDLKQLVRLECSYLMPNAD